MRIPFDSLCLAAVVAEAQTLVGSRVEALSQTDEDTAVLSFWSGSANWLLLSAHPQYARAHLLTRRPECLKPSPPFSLEAKKRLMDAEVKAVRQRGLDRVLEVELAAADGTYVLVAELMGKHSNVMLVAPNRAVVAALKWVGAAKSVRSVLPGKPYAPPPFEPRPSLLDAANVDDLRESDGGSPFLVKLVAAGMPLATVHDAVRRSEFRPVYSDGHGAYPLSVAALGLPEVARPSFSQAVEQHFASLIGSDRLEQARHSLGGQLERVLLARDVAVASVAEALEAARNAKAIQQKGELILAYQGTIQEGDLEVSAWDYDGHPMTIPIRADLTPVENADRYFRKSKRAKARAAEVGAQRERLEEDRAALRDALARLDSAASLDDVEEVRELASKNRWLQKSGEAKAKEDRPFEGHAVRELLSPGGWRVLYGDNSTANDYLTTKLARPSDLWFHVRGAPSAHVILCTNNQPNRVQGADLLFAAITAVRHSPSKHSGYVSVDYTQKRYVRKPRGAAPGFATYTHEKTLHVDGDTGR